MRHRCAGPRDVRRADGARLLDEGAVREAAAAAPGERERQPRSSDSTSPGSGKRWTTPFEKTTVPSFTTSNCPLSPGVIDASNPSSFSSAARLAARVS
jgi:hypothetical protein